MSDLALLNQKIDQLYSAVAALAATQGATITTQQLCKRLNVCRSTFSNTIKKQPRFPRPLGRGRWSLADVMRWEQMQGGRT